MKEKRKKEKGIKENWKYAALISALLIGWGSYSAGSKAALQKLDVFQLNLYVFLAAFLVYFGIFVWGKAKAHTKQDRAWKEEKGKLMLCGVLSWGYFFFYNLAIFKLPAMEASIINYCFPVLIVIMDACMRRAKIPGRVWIGSLMGLAGVVVIMTGGHLGDIRLSNWKGDLLALAAACCWAMFSVLSSTVKTSITRANLVYMTVGSLLSVWAAAWFSDFVWLRAETLLLVLWMGGISFALSNYLWLYLVGHCSLQTAAAVSFLTPFVTVLLIAVLLGERISAGQMYGLLLIMIGIGVQKIRRRGCG